MSGLSNPAAGAAAGAPRYVEELLAILGDRDPLAVQRELPAALREAVRGLDDDALRRPEAPGKWSVIQVLGHLADTELVYRYRMRRIVAQPGASIEGYDQDEWARRLDYGRLDAGRGVGGRRSRRARSRRPYGSSQTGSPRSSASSRPRRASGSHEAATAVR